jgi:hypothetical protein
MLTCLLITIKDTDKELMKEYIGQDLEGSQDRSFCPCGAGVLHLPSSLIPQFRDFYGGFVT